ncbi:MAG: hypothetical protein RL757_2089 [Bacteroidota bacterium]|jgi:hypothetical protein
MKLTLRWIPLFVFLMMCQHIAFAQKKAKPLSEKTLQQLAILEDSMAAVANIVVNDTIPEHRMAANDILLPLVKRFLETNGSYAYLLENVPTISVKYADDGAFRMLTWEVREDYKTHQYYGFLQYNSSKPKYVTLDNQFQIGSDTEQAILTEAQWLGGVVYNIKSFETKSEKRKYLVFAYNSGDGVEKTKICDVLTPRGKNLQFGSPVFVGHMGKKAFHQNRLILSHSVWTTIRLNYDEEMKLIVHDHLEKRASQNPEDGLVGIPDGTYHGFVYKDGKWEWIEKLPNQILDAPPTDPNASRTRRSKIVDRENVKAFDWPEEVKAADKKKKE